jgi:ABC-type polysaccharide/polyol phosphate export permease
MSTIYSRAAINDISRSLKHLDLAAYLAWEDIRQRYVRTLLGPLWIVLSTGIWFGILAFVMGNLFSQDTHQYVPFLISGLLVWSLIASSISESTLALISASSLITSFPLPIFMHYFRFMTRNFIIFLHNLLIFVVVAFFFPPPLTASTWLVIPGLAIDLIILFGISIFLSLANLRYRDTNLAVISALQVLPIVTPIFWDRGMLKNYPWIADLNPFYHMLQIVRAPMLGQAPAPESWLVTIAMAIGATLLSCAVFVRYRHRIIFWL